MRNIYKTNYQAAENVDGREREKEGKVQSSSFISIFFIRTFLVSHQFSSVMGNPTGQRGLVGSSPGVHTETDTTSGLNNSNTGLSGSFQSLYDCLKSSPGFALCCGRLQAAE